MPEPEDTAIEAESYQAKIAELEEKNRLAEEALAERDRKAAEDLAELNRVKAVNYDLLTNGAPQIKEKIEESSEEESDDPDENATFSDLYA